MGDKLTVAICQMKVVSDKDLNLARAEEMIRKSAQRGADLVVLPEIFNGPYDSRLFPDYAEPFPGPTTKFLSRCARENNIMLVGGSIIERDGDGRLYNTSYVLARNGGIIGRHRKIHLFDIDIPGQISFKESETLSAGNSLTVINYEDICLGVMICYDVRFPELARSLTLKGTQLLVIPAAFNLVTGPAHWEITMRSRAVDNQMFVLAASPARNMEANYKAWGHSMVVDPWGTIIVQTGEQEDIVYAELDLALVEKVRQELPLLQHRRPDLY